MYLPTDFYDAITDREVFCLVILRLRNYKMAAYIREQISKVMHWNEHLFSFRSTRSNSFKFENGHFVMLGLEVDGKPLVRAYSIASANYEDFLEFFSIKVPNGPLTSKLQHLKVGDTILMSQKPVGTLVIDDLNPGRNLNLLATGTGLAPFLSVVKDPKVYERFERVRLVHSVRKIEDLAYFDYLSEELKKNEYVGNGVMEKFEYLPTVTRESFRLQGRITDLIENETLALNASYDRVMLCGSQRMLKDVGKLLDSKGFHVSTGQGSPGDYVIERAFVE